MLEKVKLEDLPRGYILSFCEICKENLNLKSLEILGPLKDVAKGLNTKLVLLCLAKNREVLEKGGILKRVIADEVWCIFNQALEYIKDDLYSRVIAEVIRHCQPEGFFFPATLAGCAIAPRVAGILELGLCAHVTKVYLKNSTIIMARPTFGENIIAELSSQTKPVMATISAGGEFLQNEYTPQFKEILFPENFKWESNIKIRKIKKAVKKENKLSRAKLVIAGGRGLKNKENFEKLFRLAELLGGEVGATRPVCYEGWAEEDRMIGVSGVSISPDVYVGFGISGAIQHTAGIEKAKFIIAVNQDRNASLVKMADVSFITDAPKFLDILLKKIQK